MVLVDREIAHRAEHEGMIDSFDKNCLTNIGYDLRAKKFYVSRKGEESVTLHPNESAFVESVEVVDLPTNLLGRVVLKNSRIRQGLNLESPVYQPGHKTRIYFRLTNVSADSIVLYAGERYGTILFEQLTGEPDHPYDGGFRDEMDFRGMADYEDIYKRQIREIEKKTDDLKTMESGIYGNVLVILTVFVALFSFLTTNVSLAANSATVKEYFLFNALLLGCISFLVALIETVIKPKKNKWTNWIPAALCFLAAYFLFR